jgi:hypothetical protein
MDAKYLLAGIVVLIFLFSNLAMNGTVYAKTGQGQFQKETLVIDTVEKNYSLSSEKSLVLIVSGANNRITVENGTNVSEIALGGIGNLVLIPFGQKPRIIQGGSGNGVFRYG